jgi:hypothetical protein
VVPESQAPVGSYIRLQGDPAVGECIDRTLLHTEVEQLRDRRRVDPNEDPGRAIVLHLSDPDRAECGDLRSVGEVLGDARRELAHPALVGLHDQVGTELGGQGVGDGSLHGGGDDGHRRHKSQADHQCRGGRGGAARVAAGVASSQAARDRDTGREGTESGSDGPRGQWCEQRDADEERGGTDADEPERLRGRAAKPGNERYATQRRQDGARRGPAAEPAALRRRGTKALRPAAPRSRGGQARSTLPR